MKALPVVRGGRIPPKEHRKLLVEDGVNEALERLIFAKLEMTPNARRDCLFMPHQMGPMWVSNPLDDDDDREMFNAPEAVDHPELVWPVGCGVVFHTRNEDWGDHYHCMYAKSVPAKQLRGSHRFVGKYNIGTYEGYLRRDGRWKAVVNYASWLGHRWVDAGRIRYSEAFLTNIRNTGGAPITIGDPPEGDEWGPGERAAMCVSMALTYRYEWGAQFAIDNSAKVIVPTTPAGILELFNDRDKPADVNRRAALRHWVSQHLRQRSGGDFSDVRRHLRGQTAFNWRGFDVVVRPSQFDEEENARKRGEKRDAEGH